MIEIASARLTAAINPHGAELSSLRDPAGRELMTDADPAFWSGRAPLLFPIVGRLVADRYRLDGRDYSLPQHGFARRRDFALAEQGADRVTFRLEDDAETRAVYPFAFTLDATYRLDDATLWIEIAVTNRDTHDMPASFGFHPAFAWPLPYGRPRGDHRILFDEPEFSSLRYIGEGGIAPDRRTSPVVGQTLPLSDDLFTADALIWDQLASRGLLYGAEDGPQLRIRFPDTGLLGIWTKPGARFVCVEPWWGIADPAGFDGEIWDKPGIQRLAPGETRRFGMDVTLLD
ncbi:aldose 1-epimerase family protein [Sphingomonas sp. TDK1]|uniref:aldose 1-epimerase family protein n=1 Tax=Sphingomonas sp. TDK1 TaxID=453247 RepID=UPI0007D9B323|nr:aldose 1-epimerase family protein [Sphingomonas sp. TDK1]OAN65960.1 aldose epimerase [Sphingomonas sp. TDK1]